MAKKGDAARAAVTNKIVEAFDAIGSYVATQDKKIFVNMPDGPGGEVLQFAISITMPKTQISGGSAPTGGMDWSAQTEGVPTAAPMTINTELSGEDKAKVQALMQSLGIND